ncbi:hypothetical protein HN51_001662, partial [Arachis hypogaea]
MTLLLLVTFSRNRLGITKKTGLMYLMEVAALSVEPCESETIIVTVTAGLANCCVPAGETYTKALEVARNINEKGTNRHPHHSSTASLATILSILTLKNDFKQLEVKEKHPNTHYQSNAFTDVDYYKVLEVDYDVTDKNIKLNYRRLAL